MAKHRKKCKKKSPDLQTIVQIIVGASAVLGLINQILDIAKRFIP